jgi:hypothetical protein
MTKCQHCKKLTHSEHLNVYYHPKDQEKIHELTQMENWTPKYMYQNPSDNPLEYGKLKVGDIVIHFISDPTISKDF